MSAGHDGLPADPIQRALARAHGVLPDQGPIGVFIHHNTLHAYQHLPFHEAVVQGANALGAEPYLSLSAFRAALAAGRVREEDLVCERDLYLGARARESVLGGLSRADFWHLMLTTVDESPDEAGLAYAIRTGHAAVCADLALWRACTSRVERAPRSTMQTRPQVLRHRDALVALGCEDPDAVVHAELVRLASGFLDQGHARETMPGRERGFLYAATRLYAVGGTAPSVCRGIEQDVRTVLEEAWSAHRVVSWVLEDLGVSPGLQEAFVFDTALALPGWAGMFARLERHPEELPHGPPAALADFLAVRLLLERRAYRRLAQQISVAPDFRALASRVTPGEPASSVLDAVRLWHAASAAGLGPEAVERLADSELRTLEEEGRACSNLVRRRIFQNAYERTYRQQILDAMAARRALPADVDPEPPRAQFVFCIDEREESIRRALEEQHPGLVTFGAAGFFGVAIDYQGIYDREPAAHCPVVVTPAHVVREHPVYPDLSWHALRLGIRDQWHGWERRAASASRTLFGGAGLSFLLGPLSGLRTVIHLLTPRSVATFDRRVKDRVAPRPGTRLSTLRASDAERSEAGKHLGFSLEECVDRVAALLTNIGLVRDFAPVVVVLGHGSTSLNNPHESAHDCGACGGRRGGANARLFADMANRPDVRDGVRAKGIDIPASTWFIGALHDTANDEVLYYDLATLPTSHAAAFDEAYWALERARRDNAQERSRRFDDAPLTITPEAALAHVEERSASLAQPRPEYGHCTNAICVVGRRSLTRGLHLDRRAFLVSYDPAVDSARFDVLERILAAVGPVGAGISLEYYFSSVDNDVFGCGTKLPHNITGLIGVMNGHASDLRTGLPLQMVEIHEPMRLLLVVDASPEALLTVAGRQREVAELVLNEWVQLVSAHPDTGDLAVFERGAFVPYMPRPTLLPVVEQSSEWHMRTRAHVPPALVRRALPDEAVGPGHYAQAAESGHRWA